MKAAQRARVLAGLVAAVAMVGALVVVFRAYQDPANVVQWLALLQLCR